MCLCLNVYCHFSVVILREGSASWARSGVSEGERTRRSVSKEKATPQLLPPNPVSVLRKTSTGEVYRKNNTNKKILKKSQNFEFKVRTVGKKRLEC